MTYQLIEINKLERSPHNVRKTEGHAALEELKASILAHGLMQNLIVIPGKKGKYHVIAGGRRLEALRTLQAEGKLPGDHAVQCQIVESERTIEVSLAENTIRQAMHPADEFEAFAALIEQGHTAAQVAERFGTTEKHVLQRMKLGRVSPELLESYRAGEVTLDALMAFAITDDHKRQVSVWKSLEGWQENNARAIRQKLTEQTVSGTDPRAVFVGLDAYKAAGGKVKADLFSEVVYLENPDLLERLANDRLEAEAEKLRAEGWGWVELETEDSLSPYRCRRIEAKPVNAPEKLLAELERARAELSELSERIDAEEDEDDLSDLWAQQDGYESRIAEIEDQLEAYAAFDPEEMKTAGCYVSIARNGELDVERGLVKPEVRSQTEADDGDTLPLASAPAKKEKPEFSQSVIADMAAYRCQAAQVEIASHPEIAFDLLVFHTASNALSMGRYCREGLDVHFRKTFPKPSIGAKNAATARLDAVREGLPLAWMDIDGEAERFAAFCQLPVKDKHRILAYCTALTLKPGLAGTGDNPSAYEAALALTGGNVAEYWRPTKDNYLSRVTKDQLLEIGESIFGGDFKARWRTAKKSELAAMLDRGISNHNQDDRPEVQERLKNWLPKGMEFRAVEPEALPVKEPKKRGRKPA